MPVVVVVLGWVVVHAQQLQLENRRDKRLLLDQIKDEVRSISRRAMAYHTKSERNQLEEGAIKFDLDQLSTSMECFFVTSDPVRAEMLDRVIALRGAITLRNFESATYEPLGAQDLDRISAVSQDLVIGLEQVRLAQCLAEPGVLVVARKVKWWARWLRGSRDKDL